MLNTTLTESEVFAIIHERMCANLKKRLSTGQCYFFRFGDAQPEIEVAVKKRMLPHVTRPYLMAAFNNVMAGGRVVSINRYIERQDILDWCAKQASGGFVGQLLIRDGDGQGDLTEVFCSTPELAVGFKLYFS